MFFEITVTYWDDVSESIGFKIKKFKDVIVCSAENYTDAEAQAIRWADENLNVDYKITPIKELDVKRVVSNSKGGLWFLVKGVHLEYNDSGKIREHKVNYLVEAEDSSEATKIASKLLEEDFRGTSRVIQVSETKIKESLVSC